MGLIKRLLIGTGIVLACAAGAGCAETRSHIKPVKNYQNKKTQIENQYNENSDKIDNQSKREYGNAVDKESAQEAKEVREDLRKDDPALIEKIVREAEEKRNYDQRIKEVEKRLKKEYNLGNMFTYTNTEPSNFRVGAFAFTAEQDSEREKPRKRAGVRAEAGYVFDNGWSVSGIYELDGERHGSANDVAFTNMTSTTNTYGAKLGKVFDLGKGITLEPYIEGGVRVEGNKITGAFYGSGAPINHTNTQSIAYGGGGISAGVNLGKGWKFVAGVGGKKYEGGETRTTSRNAQDEFQGFAGFTIGGN